MLLVVLVGVAVRAAVLVKMGVPPRWAGDWLVYARVAQNILRGCGVSLSDPASGACVPHFGGNGLPGYPAFVAVVQALFGRSIAVMCLAQIAVASLAPARLLYGAWRLGGPWVGLAAGLVAAVSPPEAVWVRDGYTEALALACAVWWVAEVALSLAERRLRVLGVAAPLVVGLFLRLDFVLFLLPTALAGLYLHGVRDALARGAAIAVVIALPIGLWEARNLAEGVSPLPPSRQWMLVDGSVGPLGYLRWVKTWARTEEQRGQATFFLADDYKRIAIPLSAVRDDAERARVSALVEKLLAQSGHPFPRDVDAGFAQIAQEREQAMSLGELIRLRADQAWALWRLWATPLPGAYLPYPEASAPLLTGEARWMYRPHDESGVSGFAESGWRFLAAVLFLGALGVAAVARRSPVRLFAAMAVVFIVAKTVLCVSGLFLEERYTVTVTPLVEFTDVLAVAWLWDAVRRRRGAVAAYSIR
jgi:hypothetical protein